MGNYPARNSMFAMGNSVATKVEATHGDCSAELQSSRSCIAIIGQLAARCPSGEEAQGEVTSGVGHGLARSRSRWLVRARWQDAQSRRPAYGRLDADNVAATQPNRKTRAGRSDDA